MSLTDALVEAVQSLPDDKQQEVLDFAHFLRDRSGTNAPPSQPKIPLPDEDARLSATAALFAEMSADEESDTPEQIAQGIRDWEAFRDAINETRACTGARAIYQLSN